MNLVSLILVFLIEQAKPLPRDNAVNIAFERHLDRMTAKFNSGDHRQGVLAWLAVVLPIVAGVMLVHYLVCSSAVLVLLLNVAILYLTMGFRQFSGGFNQVMEALRDGDLAAARDALSSWRGESAEGLSATEIAKLALEHGLIGAHRHVFGVMFWFLVLPGPSGAVLYTISAIVSDKWRRHGGEDSVELGGFARRVLDVLEWVPARLTAATFAVVGNFEDATYCWRTQSNSWGNPSQGIVLSAAAGALGVRLGETVHRDGVASYRPELGLGDAASVDYMVAGIGLVWRSVLIWAALIALVTFATWVA